MFKQKEKNVRSKDLLERLKINSIEIDLIENGIPIDLNLQKSKTGKVDLEEMKQLATRLSIDPDKEYIKEKIVNKVNELQDIKEECYEEDTKK